MQIRYIYIVIILEYCQCCRSNIKPTFKESTRNSMLNVRIVSNARDKDSCDDISVNEIDKQVPSADDITIRYDENKDIELICTGNDLPPGHYLVWHQTVIGNKTFATPPQDQGYMPYSLKLHMEKFDDNSYVICSARKQSVDVSVSKKIYFELNDATASTGFGNFIPEYYYDSDTINPHVCNEGYTIIRNSTTRHVNFYTGKNIKMNLSEADNGTMIACGYFKYKSCNDHCYKCEVERIIKNKYIYLYKNDNTELITNKKTSLPVFVIAGVAVVIIIMGFIISITFRLWKSKRRNDQQAEEPIYATCEPHMVYAELELIESYRSQRRSQNNDAPYATITGVITRR